MTVFKENTEAANALAFGPDGRLYASQPARQRIVSYGGAGDEKVVAQNVETGHIALNAKGEIYYTDGPHKTVGRIDSQGRKNVAYSGGEIATPTGLAFSADQAMLFVTDVQARFSWSFQIAADGSLANGEPFLSPRDPGNGVISRSDLRHH